MLKLYTMKFFSAVRKSKSWKQGSESKKIILNVEWCDAGTETKPACSVSPMDPGFNCLILLCTHVEFLKKSIN